MVARVCDDQGPSTTCVPGDALGRTQDVDRADDRAEVVGANGESTDRIVACVCRHQHDRQRMPVQCITIFSNSHKQAQLAQVTDAGY